MEVPSFAYLTPPVRWGILGCGDVCETKSGPAFYKSEGAVLQAVMRRDADKAEDFAGRHHVPNWYHDADQLINDPEVDAVYIATPPSSHAFYAIRTLRAGKPVYLEKPMAVSYSECEQINQVSYETGIPVLVAYYRRSLPYFRKVKELIEDGEIGKILTVNVAFHMPSRPEDSDPGKQPWRLKPEIAGAGYFYDMACHTLDILDFLFGRIAHVSGYAANCAGLYETEDTVGASFHFDSGIIGCGDWSYVAAGNLDRIEVTGTRGNIRFSTFSFDPIEVMTGYSVARYSFPRPEHIQSHMIEEVTAQFCGIGQSPSDGISAARTNKVMDMILGKLS